ncbi:hypothetical protein N2152v2_003008 [Parachlorella kessleri]
MISASLQGVWRPRLAGLKPAQYPAKGHRQLACGAVERGDAATPLEVFLRDIQYLEGRTGLDLHTPLGNVAQAHDELVSLHNELVAVLNPIAGDKIHRDLEEQIAGLQHQLAVAHQQVHATEQRVEDTVSHLTELEGNLRRAWAASPPAASGAEALAAQQTAISSTPTVMPSTATRIAALPPPVLEEAAVQQIVQEQQRQQQQAVEEPASRRCGKRSNGLESSLSLPEGLKNFWYPVEFSSRLPSDEMVTVELFEETWVLFRDQQGLAGCVKDECAHRACPLSLGKVVDGQPQCPYHGWQYDRSGACTKMPSTVFCKGIGVRALPVVEQDGLLWVWPGELSLATGEYARPPAMAQPPQGFQVHAELVMDVPVEHGLLLENLLDLAHAPFTHTSTFAKGWPIPDVVRFHAGKVLGGHWEPYPIDMEFGPPCLVLSTIGLAQPGKIERGARAAGCSNHLHQLHACLPSTSGRTKLLYRMSLDFMHWTKHVPGIMKFWESIASQVLGEDLVLVAGQQDRLQRGADVWRNPVPYDKLGVRYRRWRNAAAAGDSRARRQMEAQLGPMSAGQLFDHTSSDEEEEGCQLDD